MVIFQAAGVGGGGSAPHTPPLLPPSDPGCLPAVTLQRPQPANLRPPMESLPGKRGCSKGHLTQKPRLVENCREMGDPGVVGCALVGCFMAPWDWLPTQPLVPPTVRPREGSEQLMEAGPQAGQGMGIGAVDPLPDVPNPSTCLLTPSTSTGSARGRLRPGPLTFRQSWGWVSTNEYCTCGGLTSGPWPLCSPPSPPGGTHPAMCRPV